jgi:hypothetical protein
MIAFTERSYGEIVLHAPPVNVCTLVMLPFVPFPSMMVSVSRYFSLMIFWFENLIGVLFFMIFEIILIPIVFLKTIFNIIYSTSGLFTTVFNVLKWLIFGIFYLFAILSYDVFMLIKILTMHRGCKEYKEEQTNKGQEEAEDDEENSRERERDMNQQVFNEVRGVVIKMFLETYKQSKGEIEEEQKKKDQQDSKKEEKIDYGTIDILQEIKKVEEEPGFDASLYVY